MAVPNSVLCPVKAFKNMVRLNPALPSEPAFNFKRGKKVTPVQYNFLQKFLKTCVNSIGLDGSKFSSHSFRRGGATWAFKAQVPSELIKVQGDWASQAYMRYLDLSLDQRALVAQRMTDEILKLGI
jgi:integrase